MVYHHTLAQQANLEIALVNDANQPIPSHPVRITNEDIGFSVDRTTNGQGRIRLTGLSTAGAYVILADESDAYRPLVSGETTLRSNQTRSVILQLQTAEDVELSEVVVMAPARVARINSVNAEVASELTAQEIEALPVDGRDITRTLYRLPNVTQATGFFPEAPNVSINGANPLFNNYLIDGMDNNEQFLGGTRFNIPIGFVQNVTVLTNNYSAEFGNTGNGIINVTTKSGSNELSGEAFLVSRPGWLDASTTYPLRDLSGNPVKDGFQRYQGGFGLGGAIVRDQTFFSTNYEHTTDLKDNILSSPDLGISETVRGQNTFDYISGKIDHFWSQAAKSSLRANVGRVSIGRQAGGLTGGLAFPSAANAQRRNSVNIANNNLFSFGALTLESNVQYASFHWAYANPENPDSPDVTVTGPSGQTVAVLGHPGYVFDSEQRTWQLQEKLTYQTGRHTLKAGLELLSTRHRLFGGGNVNGSYTVQLTDEQLRTVAALNRGTALSVTDIPADALVTGYQVELQPNAYGTTQTIYGAYLEDQFQLNDRLTLSLGLRYDYDNLSRGGSARGDYNNVAPRTSFNYQLNSRSAVRGGYGIFYDKILYAIYSDALQQNNTSADFNREIRYLADNGLLPADTDIEAVTFDGNLTVGASGNTLGIPYLDGPPASTFADQRNLFSGERRILNPNGYQNPLTQQFTLGYQYQVKSDMLFYVDLLYNQGSNLFRTRNLNAPASWDYARSAAEGIARSTSWADATRPLPIYDNAYALIEGDTVRGVAKSLVMTETEGASNYYAASVNLQKNRGDDPFSYRLIYTLSYLENNTEDINFRAMDANDFAAEWGPSINDRRHVINAFASYYPIDPLTITVATLVQSGQPVNRIPDASQYRAVNQDGSVVTGGDGNPVTTNDLNGDGGAFGDAYVGNSDRYPGVSRNSDRLPWAATVDLSVQYEVPLGKPGQAIALRADVFNVFNANNLSGYSNNATQSNQIQVGAISEGIVQKNAAPPRQFQFSLRYLF